MDDPLSLYLLLQDPAAEVTAWDNGMRLVTFQMPLKIPDFLKKAFGVESVKVRPGVRGKSLR